MVRGDRKMLAAALWMLLTAPVAYAQATTDDLPNLSTATQASTTSAPSSSAPASTATTSASGTTTTNTDASSTTSVAGVITDAPDIGAGIPTLVVPDTSRAPFMQKSDLPEGTVFIAVGGVLAFLGLCVLLWRGLVAWSVNRSVRRAAIASIRGEDKRRTWAPSNYNRGSKGGLLTEYDAGSSMSLDALTSAGKHIKDQNHRLSSNVPPPTGLFFSPTAQAQTGRNSPTLGRASPAFDFPSRGSTHLPAGYYASPSAGRVGGGASTTTIGGSLAPYARHSAITPSPPRSPDLPPTIRSTGTYNQTPTSRDGLRPSGRGSPTRDQVSRDGYGPSLARGGDLYAQHSSSSLMVGTGGRGGTEQLGGSRAPSAYLDDIFDNHGSGPRERF